MKDARFSLRELQTINKKEGGTGSNQILRKYLKVSAVCQGLPEDRDNQHLPSPSHLSAVNRSDNPSHSEMQRST